MKRAVEILKGIIPRVKEHVNRRVEEFSRLGREGKTHFDFRPFLDVDYEADLFSELCFCILTANSSASMGIRIQAEVGSEGFMKMSREELTEVIARHGHRFPDQRAERIVSLRERWEEIRKVLEEEKDPHTLRRLLADPSSPHKIKGFGYKEASHFLRNTGHRTLAILDRHVYRFMVETGLYPEVKTMTPKRYLDAERILGEVCRLVGVSQAELDLYIWFARTGKVLK
ncbi:MAG: N-glycosylase/DNA lyase [Aquificota bacterium]|nr:N-glycosylase/DNA lyase [Aquificota bacterium]